MINEAKTVADACKKMQRLMSKFERFLCLACRAEQRGDYFRAGRCFVLALLCEGRIKTKGNAAYTYVLAAMPVYWSLKVQK